MIIIKRQNIFRLYFKCFYIFLLAGLLFIVPAILIKPFNINIFLAPYLCLNIGCIVILLLAGITDSVSICGQEIIINKMMRSKRNLSVSDVKIFNTKIKGPWKGIVFERDDLSIVTISRFEFSDSDWELINKILSELKSFENDEYDQSD